MLADALERKLQSGEVARALCNPAIISNAEGPCVRALGSWINTLQEQGISVRHQEPIIDDHYVARFAAFARASGGFVIG